MTDELTKYFIYHAALELLESVTHGRMIDGARVMLSWPDELSPGMPTRWAVKAESRAGDVYIDIRKDGGEK